MNGAETGLSARLLETYQQLDGQDLIRAMVKTTFPGRVAVVSSFGAESAVLLDLVAQVDPSTPVIFLDTGELFDETHEYRQTLVDRLGLTDVRIVKPDPADLVEAEELWQTNPDRCCHLRKVLPLERAVKGFAALIDGRKRAHGYERANLQALEIADDVVKVSPLWSWSEEQIATAFKDRNLPEHPLTAQGYRSIGCWPCTRPTKPGESPRAGRWAGSAKTECGIHIEPKAKEMNDLDVLESQSIYIFREAFNRLDKIAMLWSIGKDSNVMLWLARKAFFGHVPFPVVHVDTTYKIPEMIEFRDRFAKEWNLPLIIGKNQAALDAGMGPEQGRVNCCSALKTEGLKQIIAEHGFTGIFAGIRRDEEGTRAKERVFSPRNEQAEWDVRDQPPEFWDQFKTDFAPGTSLRIHPLLAWTELDVWRYIQREGIPLVNLYFAKNGRRYRSLGCAPCTGSIESNASTVEEIILELETTKTSERAGRAQDKESEDAFERLRSGGYM